MLADKTEREMFPADAQEQAKQKAAIDEIAARGMALAAAIGALKGRGNGAGSQSRTMLRSTRTIPPCLAASASALDRIHRTGRADIFSSIAARLRACRCRIAGTQAAILDAQYRARHFRLDDRWMPSRARRDRRFLRRRRCRSGAASCNATPRSPRISRCRRTNSRAFNVSGFGGSDLSPAMVLLAEDPQVTAVVIVTDGTSPSRPSRPPYGVLWVLPQRGMSNFNPPYGQVLMMDGSRQ